MGREPVLVAALKASFMFLADLSRALPIVHRVDFVELAGYGGRSTGGESAVRLLKDLDADILDRDVLVVEDVVDTGLTLNYLDEVVLAPLAAVAGGRDAARPPLPPRSWTTCPCATSASRRPDEFFVGYGFDLDERYRNLPDLHLAAVLAS